jgi:hypothetical protein
MDRDGKASIAVLEVLIWKLVNNGTLPALPLATELERYSRYVGDAADLLEMLSHIARAATCTTLDLIDTHNGAPTIAAELVVREA